MAVPGGQPGRTGLGRDGQDGNGWAGPGLMHPLLTTLLPAPLALSIVLLSLNVSLVQCRSSPVPRSLFLGGKGGRSRMAAEWCMLQFSRIHSVFARQQHAAQLDLAIALNKTMASATRKGIGPYPG
jgi:hypothetical protein